MSGNIAKVSQEVGRNQEGILSIYKYVLKLDDVQQIAMPSGASIISAQEQNGSLCVWAIVDPGTPLQEVRTIYIYGTGHPISERLLRGCYFICTVQTGRFVWHVFANRNRG